MNCQTPVMAIDVGLKRIGLAISYDLKVILPVQPVLRKNRDQAACDVAKALYERDVKTMVVGIPMEGSSYDEMKRRIEHFVNLIPFDGEKFFIDESFSSYEAGEKWLGQKLSRKEGWFDSVAASIILERFFEKFTKSS